MTILGYTSSNITIDDFIIQNASNYSAGSFGGGIAFTGMDRCVITNNYCLTSDGGIYLEQCNSALINSEFDANYSSAYGAAIYIGNGINDVITGTFLIVKLRVAEESVFPQEIILEHFLHIINPPFSPSRNIFVPTITLC